ncbi:amidase [Acuticoccus sediminis]|uniref:Amidase n=1 Tax=Acuticoccus sediminis TaxID=2184697 RepID=A0A8B2NWV3_9HYPH|nr:amidase [Acuticoccus sediminis]RAI02014.1 amidase [Acuticoccus sediminis]
MSETSCARAPGRLGDLMKGIVAGDISPSELVDMYLARIDEVQPLAEPWRVVDAEGARRVAEQRTAEARSGALRGPLHGIPVAVKDIIDVAGFPTRCNARMLEDAPPATADAEVVAALRCAGAIIMGKAHTTEFAFTYPSPARNPHNLAHTPGGSSSGSAAAVASGCVPLALGTQTMASVNRPAAYCGIGAFKPSSRLLSTYGVSLLAPMYDTVGFYGQTTADAIAMFEALAPPHVVPAAAPLGGVLVLDDPLIFDMVPAMAAALERMVEACREAGIAVERARSPVPFEEIRQLHWRTMHYEVGRLHTRRLGAGDGISDRFRAVIEEGLGIDDETYLADRTTLQAVRARIGETMKGRAVLWPAAPGPAPEGLDWTGDPRYIAPWTALGGPMVTIPAGVDGSGLPLAGILIGRPGDDANMCALARTVAAAAEVLP